MKHSISQEGLKLIACLTMLIDHIGYKLVYPIFSAASSAGMPDAQMLRRLYLLCRCIGRLSWPVFAFLLVEGLYHTRSRSRYALRLGIGAILSEIPYNLMISDQLFWHQQSVMLTLLLGLCTVIAMEKCRSLAWKPVAVIPFALAAELLGTDYGWAGIALIALFALSRDTYSPNLMRTGGMIVLFHAMSSYVFRIGNFSFPMQVLGVLSMVFIGDYKGRKLTSGKAVQWMFYLFYPVHLLILWGIGCLLPSGVAI